MMGDWIIKYWLEALFGLIVGIMSFLIKRLNGKINEQEAIKLGVQALLRDRIIQLYNYHSERGHCPIYARENLEELVKQYDNLGGNGVVHELREKLRKLPTESGD